MDTEKELEIIEQIVHAYQKSEAAGDIAISSLDYLDDSTRSFIMYKVAFDARVPLHVRKPLYAETGTLFKHHWQTIDKNLPVKKLIELFKDKRSGKVNAAVRQLKERFLHLDYKDQIKVMKLFLDDSVSYRRWCYKMLKSWREPMFDEVLVSHWQKYKDDKCLETIVEQLPAEKIKEIFPLIRHFLNNYKLSQLIQRFGNELWLEFDKELLKSTSPHIIYYLKTMSMFREPLSKSECCEILYDYLQEEFDEDNLDDLWEINQRFEDECHFRPPMCIHFDSIRLPSPNKNPLYISVILKLFARMGHYDIVTGIVSWGDSINMDLPKLPISEEKTDYEVEEASRQRFRDYIYLLKENMPYKLQNFEEQPGFEVSSIFEQLEIERFKQITGMSDMIDKYGFDDIKLEEDDGDPFDEYPYNLVK